MNGPAELDSRGCLLVVTTFADQASVIEPIVDAAAARIAASPMLGDFIEIRYVDSGPRPTEADQHGDAISRLVIDLTCPATGAAENYFALAVVDQSAATVGQFITDCVADPVIIELKTKTRGFATFDDPAGSGPPNGAEELTWAPEVIMPANDGWTRKTLTDALWQYADQLLGDIAKAGQPGLGPAALASIREQDGRIPVPHAHEVVDDPVLDLSPAPQVQTAQAPPDDASATPDAEPRPRLALPPIPNPWVAARHRLANRPPDIPHVPQRVTSPTRAVQSQAVPSRAVPSRAVLLFMSVLGGSTGHQEDWHRARSALLDIDKRMAAAPALGYRVRAFRAAGDIPHSDLRPAGQLAKRDLRRPDRSLDFGPLLDAVLRALTRDTRATRRSAIITARPVVILFPVTAPLADPVSIRAYCELTRLAQVLWIVSDQVNKLISPNFYAGEARRFTDYPNVSEEIAELLTAHAVGGEGEASPDADWI